MELIDLNEYRSKEELREGVDYNKDSSSRFWNLIEYQGVYPLDFRDKWTYSMDKRKESKKLPAGFFREEYTTFKLVDSETYNLLYNRLINPVWIRIETDMMDKEKRLFLQGMILSIDDAAYGFKIGYRDYKGLEEIRNKLFEYLNSHDVVNAYEFRDFGISLGGEDCSW